MSAPAQSATKKQSAFRSLRKALSDLEPKKKVSGALDKVAPGALARVVEEKLRSGVDEVAYSLEKRQARQRVQAKGEAALPSAVEAHDLLTWTSTYMGAQLTIIDALLETLGELATLEVLKETGHGARILDAIPKLRVLQKGIALRQAATTRLLEEIGVGPEPDLPARAAVHHSLMIEFVTSLSRNLEEIQRTCTTALTFEAVKAIVSHPDEKRYRAFQQQTERGIQLVDQGIGAIETASSIIATVPDAHAKGAATGINIAMMVLKVVKAPLGRLATSFAVTRDMKKFAAGEAPGQEFGEHNTNPTLIAEMLGRKRLKDVEMVLVMVGDPLMKQLGDLSPTPPLIKKAWETVRATVTATVKAYQAERIALAKAELAKSRPPASSTPQNAMKTVPGMVDAFGADVLEGMKKKLEKNVFLALDPMGLAMSGVIAALAKRIAALIVDALPVDPAQAIDGDTLFANMDAIANTVRLVVDVRPPALGPVCPQHTDQLAPVRVVLSDPETDGDAHRWLVVLDDGTTGHIRTDGSFTAAGDDEVVDLPPMVDHTGVRLARVLLSTRQVTPAQGDEEDDRVSYAAETTEVRGRLRRTTLAGTTTWKFVVNRAAPVVEARSQSWKGRFIIPPGVREPEGYRDKATGTTVAGTWLRPFDTIRLYLFVNATAGTWEWAHAADAVGNSPVLKVMQVLDGVAYESTSDIDVLLLARSG